MIRLLMTLVKEIPLLLDPEDYETYKLYTANINPAGYAYVMIEGKPKTLHQLIIGDREGLVIDHINQIKLDCRKENLRHVTRRQNNINSGYRTDNTSGFRGVSFMKSKGRWRARIGLLSGECHLGLFDTAKEAAARYNEAALRHYGEFAQLNNLE